MTDTFTFILHWLMTYILRSFPVIYIHLLFIHLLIGDLLLLFDDHLMAVSICCSMQCYSPVDGHSTLIWFDHHVPRFHVVVCSSIWSFVHIRWSTPVRYVCSFDTLRCWSLFVWFVDVDSPGPHSLPVGRWSSLTLHSWSFIHVVDRFWYVLILGTFVVDLVVHTIHLVFRPVRFHHIRWFTFTRSRFGSRVTRSHRLRYVLGLFARL